jgi:hypothetical protein
LRRDESTTKATPVGTIPKNRTKSVPGVATTSINNTLADISLRQNRTDAFRLAFCGGSAATEEARLDTDLTYKR